MNNQLELYFKFYKDDDDKENQGNDLFGSFDDNIDDFGFSELEDSKPNEINIVEEKTATPTGSKDKINTQETTQDDERQRRREERKRIREEEKQKREEEKLNKEAEESKENTVIDEKENNEDYNEYIEEESDDEEKGSNKTWIYLLLFLLLILLGGGYFGYQYLYNEEETLPALPEVDSLAFSTEPEPELAPEPEPEETSKEGTITEIRERSGKAYIIVSSSIDGDLAMDSAKKYTKQGYQCYIIYPFNFRGKSLRYRVAVAAFDSVLEASNNLDKYKSETVLDAWVINY